MATHSSILAWRIPWTEEPGTYSPWGCCKELDTNEKLTHTHTKAEATQVSMKTIIYMYDGILFSLKNEGNSDKCYNMDEP